MKQTFTASVSREGDWFVAQCLEVDIASQGETEEEALANIREAVELYLKPVDGKGRNGATVARSSKCIEKP